MGIKAIVNTTSVTRVSVNNQKPKTVRSVLQGNNLSLSQIEGLEIVSPSSGETLVYDDATGNFVAKTLPTLNGGTF